MVRAKPWFAIQVSGIQQIPCPTLEMLSQQIPCSTLEMLSQTLISGFAIGQMGAAQLFFLVGIRGINMFLTLMYIDVWHTGMNVKPGLGCWIQLQK